ncbi:hypothetical protein EDD17DRAFT_1765284 [Pisolithus thermaeus]|nr:hypothetical protein EDD17DRAFT_1765284 [Pisolithus thermaeus]
MSTLREEELQALNNNLLQIRLVNYDRLQVSDYGYTKCTAYRLGVGAKHVETRPGVHALLFGELRSHLPDISNLEYLETIAALYSIYGTDTEGKSSFDIAAA